MTSMLADLSGNVLSMDTIDFVQTGIRANLENAQLETGSVSEGWQDKGNFDVIVLNGSVQAIPTGLLDKLNVGGRLFAVVGEDPSMSATLITHQQNGRMTEEQLFETSLARLPSAEEKDLFNF
jgi:protein-L-isoaspartate(D-aspartate) O-methyltransferase